MPAKSEKQAHWMAMSKAVKAGHILHGLQPGTMAKLRKTAASMTHQQLSDYAHVAKGPKKTHKK